MLLLLKSIIPLKFNLKNTASKLIGVKKLIFSKLISPNGNANKIQIILPINIEP